MKKLCFLLPGLLTGISALHAQHVLRHDSLGFSIDFPAEYQALPPEVVEKGDAQTTVYMFMCMTEQTEVFLVSVNALPAFEEDAESIRSCLQGAKEGILNGLSETKGKSKENFTAHTGEMTFDYVDATTGFPTRARVIYRGGRLVQELCMCADKINEDAWKKFSASLKTDW
ncbi:MAG: hypothetical protein IBJ09_08325 [Bacteroidia bacterium]|nr:hypothetical protein [Bacteroidia bacterium]